MSIPFGSKECLRFPLLTNKALTINRIGANKGRPDATDKVVSFVGKQGMNSLCSMNTGMREMDGKVKGLIKAGKPGSKASALTKSRVMVDSGLSILAACMRKDLKCEEGGIPERNRVKNNPGKTVTFSVSPTLYKGRTKVHGRIWPLWMGFEVCGGLKKFQVKTVTFSEIAPLYEGGYRATGPYTNR